MFFGNKRSRAESADKKAEESPKAKSIMQSLRSLSNPRRWLSKRTADSGGSSSAAGGVVGLGALSDGDVLAQRELEAFLEQLCEEPDFGANVNSSNVSLLEKSKAQYSSTASIAGLEGTSGGFTSLPAQLDEASVLELITAFCRRRTVARSIAADLLARAATHLRTLPNVVEFTVPPGCFLTVVGGTLHAPSRVEAPTRTVRLASCALISLSRPARCSHSASHSALRSASRSASPDLHGQFQDLMHLFRTYGFPSPTRPFLFNGDFVDRGDCGVEITLTLFALQLLHPGSVMLNRGNHEERSVHMLMGFFQVCPASCSHPTSPISLTSAPRRPRLGPTATCSGVLEQVRQGHLRDVQRRIRRAARLHGRQRGRRCASR